MNRLRTFSPIVIMGFTAMLLQITVLRQLLSTFSGNELDIGITLSFWLISVGLGSYIGRKVTVKYAFIVSFLFISVLSLPTVLAIKAIRSVLSLEPGEAISFGSTILTTAVTLFPLCFMVGLQFPLAVSYAGRFDPIPVTRNTAGKVYGIEALGSFVAGMIFTFVFSSRIGALELCLLVSLINAVTAAYLSRKPLVISLFIFPLLFFLAFNKVAPSLPWKGMQVSQTVESRYGEITVITAGDQSSIYTNGHLLFTYPDPYTDEMRTHLTMSLHPAPLKILIIGGSPATIKEFLKYPVQHIDFIELDPRVVEVSGTLLENDDRSAVEDRRVRMHIRDGRKFIKEAETGYDLISLNLPQPSTAGINRFYTTDFLQEARGILNQDGMIVLSTPQSTGYIGKRMQTASGSIYHSLKSVFRYAGVSSQEYGILFASDSGIESVPEKLENRFADRAIPVQYFNQYVFREAFSPMNVAYVTERLGEITRMNTDLRPAAYLYNLMLWTEVHGGKFLQRLPEIRAWKLTVPFALALLLILFLSGRRKRRAVYFSIFTTGFTGMSFMLSLILAYESLYGYVYEMIGILSAIFMIGLGTGTFLTRDTKRPLHVLFCLELSTVLIALASPVFFRTEPLFYIVVFLLGTLSGSQFSTANLSLNDAREGGKLYALDLIGSSAGALIPSILIVPLFGIVNTLIMVALVKAFSALIILRTLPKLSNPDYS